jgi:hypothetical protein
MVVVTPLIRYAAVKGYATIGPEGTVMFAAAMLHPVSRRMALRLGWLAIRNGSILSYHMTKGSALILYEELLVPYATRVLQSTTVAIPAIERALLNLTRFGAVSASPAAVIAGALVFAVVFPIAIATSEGQPGGDMYTPEIIDYEDSITWSPGGMIY